MDLLQLLNQLVANIASLQAQLVDAEAAAQALADAKFAEGKAIGFEEGVASVTVPPSDKLFSQEELDAKIQEAIAPLQSQVNALVEKVGKYEAFIEGEIADQAVDSKRIEAFKASLGV